MSKFLALLKASDLEKAPLSVGIFFFFKLSRKLKGDGLSAF